MIFKDYYKILDFDTNKVTIEDIKSNFRELAKRYHPDVNVGDKEKEERFKDINEAYRNQGKLIFYICFLETWKKQQLKFLKK